LASVPPQRDQQPPSQPRREGNQRIEVLTVRLPVTVVKKNRFVSGLAVNNFEVYEDGKRQKIDGFQSPSPLPLDIAVLMDTSASVRLKLPFEKDAAEDFVATTTTARKKDLMLFATFASDVELHQDFTDDQELLVRAIRNAKAGGYTRLYDAVYRVIEEKMSSAQGRDSRRIVLVLSDGADTGSDRTLKETVDIAQRFDVTVFGISTKNFSGVTAGVVESSDDKELRRLCDETGGDLFLPSEKAELYRAFSEVAVRLRSEYVLFYTPQNQNKTGKPRSIRVKLISADGEMDHKRGYSY
jgi:Ca-activated chloride channel family protein